MNREQAMKLAEAVLNSCLEYNIMDISEINLSAIVDAHVAQAGQQDVAASASQKPVVYWLDDGDDWEFNTADEFSCGRSGGVPLYTTPPAVAVPNGWQLVPVEATDDMLWALYCFLVGQITEPDRQCYRDMLAAAPKPEGGAA